MRVGRFWIRAGILPALLCGACGAAVRAGSQVYPPDEALTTAPAPSAALSPSQAPSRLPDPALLTDTGSLSWQSGYYLPGGDFYEPIRREPAPIPPARPLPFYPPEPPTIAPSSSSVTAPPDFLGSASGYLEIPVGQTAVLLTATAQQATPRDAKIATALSCEADRVLVRGLFPGSTLLEVQRATGKETYLVRVR